MDWVITRWTMQHIIRKAYIAGGYDNGNPILQIKSELEVEPVLVELRQQLALLRSILGIRIGFLNEPLQSLLLLPKGPPTQPLTRRELLESVPQSSKNSHHKHHQWKSTPRPPLCCRIAGKMLLGPKLAGKMLALGNNIRHRMRALPAGSFQKPVAFLSIEIGHPILAGKSGFRGGTGFFRRQWEGDGRSQAAGEGFEMREREGRGGIAPTGKGSEEEAFWGERGEGRGFAEEGGLKSRHGEEERGELGFLIRFRGEWDDEDNGRFHEVASVQRQFEWRETKGETLSWFIEGNISYVWRRLSWGLSLTRGGRDGEDR